MNRLIDQGVRLLTLVLPIAAGSCSNGSFTTVRPVDNFNTMDEVPPLVRRTILLEAKDSYLNSVQLYEKDNPLLGRKYFYHAELFKEHVNVELTLSEKGVVLERRLWTANASTQP